MNELTRADFKLPTLLIALSLIPSLGGIVRLISLSGAGAATPENARFLNAPAPVITHVISATVYSMLGAFQFSPRLRLRFPRWHRDAGKLLSMCGLLAATTGLWMTVRYRIPPHLQGPILYGVRCAISLSMFASIVIALSSIVRRDVVRHRAFMIRAYALGQGAGTQALVMLPWMLISGESGGVTRDVLMTLSWVINIVVAESIVGKLRKESCL